MTVVFLGLVLGFGRMDSFAQSVRPPRLNVQYHRAETAWRSGNSLLEAKARIDRVLRELPDDFEARKLRAGIFLSMGRPDEALTDAVAAARISPTDGEAHLLVCEAAVRSEEIQLALPALKQAAEHLLENPDHHIRLSRCATSLGLLDEAEAYARIALAGDDRNPASFLQLARVFVLAEENDRALSVLERGLRLRHLSLAMIREDALLRSIVDASDLPARFNR